MSSQETSATHTQSTLPNAIDFEDQTGHLLEFSGRTKAKAALLYIQFSPQVGEINEKQNNLALDAISQRLLSKARESDIFAHIKDMDFANLSIETSDKHIPTIVQKLKDELAEPIQLEDTSSIKLNAKIGVAQYPANGSNYKELMAAAKEALI
jgi:GGDEF domain-containing protein